MTYNEAQAARRRTEARRFAMASRRVESISDIGRAYMQPVDIRTLAGTVEELEAEIDRLQHRLGNQAATIRVQSETIRRLEEQAETVSDTAWTMASRYHLKWAEKTLQLIAARCGAHTSCGDALRLVLDTVRDAHIEIAKRREVLPTQDSTSPTEPPLPQMVANVPCEPVAVHPAPNVSRVGGE